MRKLSIVFFMLLESVAIAEVRVPGNWLLLDQQMSTLGVGSHGPDQLEAPPAALSSAVDSIYRVTQQSLNLLTLREQGSTPANAPSDWVPWHLDAFETQLGVSTQGLIGVMTVKGTPAVQAIWRKAPSKSGRTRSDDGFANPVSQVKAGDSTPTVELQDGFSDADLWRQVRPIYRAMLATGKVKNPQVFKTNLLRTTESWRDLAEQLSLSQGNEWWVSAIRCDFEVTASGTIVPSFLTMGGALRFRLDWKRIQKIESASQDLKGAATRKTSLFSTTQAADLKHLVLVLEQSLEKATAAASGTLGAFVPVTFRVGLGMSAAGDFGIAKGSASFLGHIYFARDISKPVPKMTYGPTLQEFGVLESNPQILIIGSREIGISAFASGELLSRVGQDRLVGGLARALKMASFFARSDKAHGTDDSHWPLFEIRGSFDLSLGGSLGLASVNGLASTMVYLRRGLTQ